MDSPNVGIFVFPGLLKTIVREIKPDIVVETGLGQAGSTIAILEQLEENGKGKLYTIEAHPVVISISSKRIPEKLLSRWELVQGTSEEVLKGLMDRLSVIDIFMHDSNHSYENQMYEYEQALPHIKVGGVIMGDDVENGAFSRFIGTHNCTPKLEWSTLPRFGVAIVKG